MKFFPKFSISVALLVMVGCAGTIPELEKAQNMYKEATQDSAVWKYAPAEIGKARMALTKAEEAFSAAETKHRAYVAQRRVEIALLQTERNVTVEKIQANQGTLKTAVQGKIEQVEALESQLSDLKSQRTGRGLEITLRDTIFEIGRADLKDDAKATLNKISKVLLEDPNRRAIVEGHTDSTGKADFNLNLSRQRAEAVAQFLVLTGVKREQLLAKGYGPEFPLSKNETPEGRQNNRRVEVILTPSGEPAEKFLR